MNPYPDIFSINSQKEFEKIALKVFRHQYDNNNVYQDFCSFLKNYRALNNKIDDLKDLCGTASDIQVLELGVQFRDEEGKINFSLLSVYDALCSNVYGMTTQEKSIFSLEWFSRLAAVSARNGFAFRTESPFRPYHAALLRAAGGSRGAGAGEPLVCGALHPALARRRTPLPAGGLLRRGQ